MDDQRRVIARRGLRTSRSLEMKTVEPNSPGGHLHLLNRTELGNGNDSGSGSGSGSGSVDDFDNTEESESSDGIELVLHDAQQGEGKSRRSSDLSIEGVMVGKCVSGNGGFNALSHLCSGSASPSNQPLRMPPPKPVRAVAKTICEKLRMKRKRASWKNASSEQQQLEAAITSDSCGQHNAKRSKRYLSFADLLDEVLLYIYSFLLEDEWFVETIPRVSRRWYRVFQREELWESVHPTVNGKVNRLAFKYYDLKNQGTEGLCYKVRHRASGQYYAMKKARVYPKGEGVPYYMLRELAFLQGLYHPHIATLERIALSNNELYVFFKYVENSLFDLINPSNNPNGGLALAPKLTKRFLYQIVQGVAFCHQRGVLHRNLKPKHLLVDMPSLPKALLQYHPKFPDLSTSNSSATINVNLSNTPSSHVDNNNSDMHSSVSGSGSGSNSISSVKETNSLSKENSETELALRKEEHRRLFVKHAEKHASIKMSDFALVRSTSIPLRQYTSEVVTLWYRAPEVLMGGRYFAAVDMWSVGCVFAEMALGKPLFPGICEIDQLFQIFSKLGTPDEKTWEGFKKMPFYNFPFPNWKPKPLHLLFPNLEKDGADLLGRMLDVNPDRRITAEDALAHPYFDSIKEEELEEAKNCALNNNGNVDANKSPMFTSAGAGNRRIPRGIRGGLGATCFSDMKHKGKHRKASRKSNYDHEVVNKQLGLSKKSLHFSCWEWARSSAKRSKLRQLPGLADPAYLISYYRYLKELELQLFPLKNHILLHNQMSMTSTQENSNVTHATNTNGANVEGTGRGVDVNNNDSATAEAAEGITGGSSGSTDDDAIDVEQSQLQNILQPVHRAMLVDWLVEVIDVFEMSLRSVFLAVNYTDRYLSAERVKRQDFQLLGATCLHIASKCEDVSYIGVEDLVICADKVYHAEDVLKLEEKVLTTLDFHLAVPTVIDFLNAFVQRLYYEKDDDENLTVQLGSNGELLQSGEIPSENSDEVKKKQGTEGEHVPKRMVPTEKANFLARYLSELSLQDSQFLVEMPSKTAAAALVLAFYYVDIPVFNIRVEALTGYSMAQLKTCLIKLKRTHLEAGTTSQLVVIKKRYEKELFKQVADITPKSLEKLLKQI